MDKSPDAFRTISEVADWLGTPTHVLRFWESRFTQVKPVKRAGGRRYYRPADMALLGGIKKLLHDDGLTIRGVQKILREQGVKHVASLSKPIDGGMDAEFETGFAQEVPSEQPAAPVVDVEAERRAPPQIIRHGYSEATPEAEAPEPEAPAPAQATLDTAPEVPAAPEDTVAASPEADAPVAQAPVDESFNPFAKPADDGDAGDADDTAFEAPVPETSTEDALADLPDVEPEMAAAPDAPVAEPAAEEAPTPSPTESDVAPEPVDAAPQQTIEQPYDYSHGEMHPGAAPEGVPEPATEDAVAEVETATAAPAPEPEDASEPASEPVPDTAPPASQAARSLPEMAPMPEGPTLSEEVLSRLRRTPVVDRNAVLPVYERLAELRGRMTAGQAGGHSG
ncbi:MerR family transcriptional regulator [Psychromarinibacter halotolerans]|uniref:MerR family transcriptional regulator n=1 Tax=Psychromarinibacter halotolerans TaxID=1775175 RepID=A0ABV7GWI6_9RHOB|nr:MerR family transcriptional regulator [Psychromarinibacter halotolerans]MDF0597468.1 MerR family transcriptional regulator [Psychromarinibacter halotolerans]